MNLTPRQREVAALVCLGMTNRQIGARLGLSPMTVKTHLYLAMVKLGAVNRAHAAAIIAQGGAKNEHVEASK